MVAEVEEPPSEAERIAVWSVANTPVVTGKVKDVALAGTVMDAGVWSAGFLVERAMTVPAAGAAPVNVTVQVVLALEARVEAVHCREEIRTAAAVRETVALLEDPLRDAVIVAL